MYPSGCLLSVEAILSWISRFLREIVYDSDDVCVWGREWETPYLLTVVKSSSFFCSKSLSLSLSLSVNISKIDACVCIFGDDIYNNTTIYIYTQSINDD